MKGLGIGVLVGVITLIGSASGFAQTTPTADAPANPGLRVGPLALSPIVRLTELGYDSNVYNLSEDLRPVGDFVSTVSPALQAWFRFGRVRATGHSQLDMYYYRTLPSLRSVDTDNGAQVDLVLNRVRLFVGGSRLDTQRRQNFEIDAIAERVTDEATVGAEVHVTGKTSFTVSTHRTHLAYAPNSLYLGTDLGQALNHTAVGETVGLRYAITPLTLFGVEVVQDRARFESQFDRNSTELRITPSVEFSPFALVSGRASVGFYRRTFSALAPQTGTSALVDLNYTLLGRTRFGISVNRKLEYSYLTVLYDYIEAGVTGSVTQRLGDSWELSGRLGRARLSYQSAATNVTAAQVPGETVVTSGVDVGYNLRHTRIGLYVEHNQRDTDQSAPNRGYQRFRIGSSATYAF